jgi:hypothetical protein
MDTPSTKNCTPLTVSGAPAVAVAVMFVAALIGNDEPAVGPVIVTVGAATTVTPTAADGAVLPAESLTRAVIDAAPVAVGVQFAVYGAVVDEATTFVPTRNSTSEMVAPVPGVAFAASATENPSGSTRPGVGAVTVAVG